MAQILDASQSNLMVQLSQFEIESCCIRLVNYAFPCSFLGVGKGFLTNHLLLSKIAKKMSGFICLAL